MRQTITLAVVLLLSGCFDWEIDTENDSDVDEEGGVVVDDESLPYLHIVLRDTESNLLAMGMCRMDGTFERPDVWDLVSVRCEGVGSPPPEMNDAVDWPSWRANTFRQGGGAVSLGLFPPGDQSVGLTFMDSLDFSYDDNGQETALLASFSHDILPLPNGDVGVQADLSIDFALWDQSH